MTCRKVYSLLFILCSTVPLTVNGTLYTACYAQVNAPAADSDQQIDGFSLAGYGEKGKKSWDLAGKTADIFETVVRLSDVVGNLYGEEETVNLTADKGDFDKADGRVHLQENVVITTSSGAKLTTDSLDWNRQQQLLTTEDSVNITRSNMNATAIGIEGKPNLNTVVLKKDVQVDIDTAKDKTDDTAGENKIIITCDGPLEVDYVKNISTFKNNVKVDTQDNLIYSDIMHIYFLSSKEKEKKPKEPAGGFSLMGTKIDKIVALGNVKIVRGENISYSDEAVYTARDKKIVLTGRPKLIIESTEDLSASFGN